jgi:hypothetical protein
MSSLTLQVGVVYRVVYCINLRQPLETRHNYVSRCIIERALSSIFHGLRILSLNLLGLLFFEVLISASHFYVNCIAILYLSNCLLRPSIIWWSISVSWNVKCVCFTVCRICIGMCGFRMVVSHDLHVFVREFICMQNKLSSR